MTITKIQEDDDKISKCFVQHQLYILNNNKKINMKKYKYTRKFGIIAIHKLHNSETIFNLLLTLAESLLTNVCIKSTCITKL